MPADRGGAYLTACTIYRDDAAYLAEWIEFHRLVGVERFFLYDNGSTDHHREVLAGYVAEGLVTVQEWAVVEPPVFTQDKEFLRRHVPSHPDFREFVPAEPTDGCAAPRRG